MKSTEKDARRRNPNLVISSLGALHNVTARVLFEHAGPKAGLPAAADLKTVKRRRWRGRPLRSLSIRRPTDRSPELYVTGISCGANFIYNSRQPGWYILDHDCLPLCPVWRLRWAVWHSAAAPLPAPPPSSLLFSSFHTLQPTQHNSTLHHRPP